MSSKVRSRRRETQPTLPVVYPEAAARFLFAALEHAVVTVHGPTSPAWQRVAKWLADRELDLADLERMAAADKLPRDIARSLQKAGGTKAFNRHVSGADLCDAFRDLAVAQWGLMAKSVLRHWGIGSTRDIGELVFALIAAERLQKQPGDTLADFDDLFDFTEAFDVGFRIKLPSGPTAKTEPAA